MNQLYRNNLIALGILSLLFSCGRQSHWSHEKIYSNYPEYSYGKVVYQTQDVVRGLDIEFIQAGDRLKTYLLVHSIPLPASTRTSKKINVTITIDEVSIECEADRLEGGQRFLLPVETTQVMIEAFLNKKDLYIALPGYQSYVSGEGFIKHFRKLNRSFMENPFRLPF